MTQPNDDAQLPEMITISVTQHITVPKHHERAARLMLNIASTDKQVQQLTSDTLIEQIKELQKQAIDQDKPWDVLLNELEQEFKTKGGAQ